MCDFYINMRVENVTRWRRGYKITHGKTQTGFVYPERIKEDEVMECHGLQCRGLPELLLYREDQFTDTPTLNNAVGWYIYLRKQDAKSFCAIHDIVQEVFFKGTCVFGDKPRRTFYSKTVPGVRAQLVKFESDRKMHKCVSFKSTLDKQFNLKDHRIFETKHANKIKKGQRW